MIVPTMPSRLPTRSLIGLALAPLCLLAACGDDAAPDGDGRSASGEVLEGSISDAMLPLDELRSQAPRLEPEPATSGDGDDPAGAGEAAEAGEAASAASDEAAAEPAAEAGE